MILVVIFTILFYLILFAVMRLRAVNLLVILPVILVAALSPFINLSMQIGLSLLTALFTAYLLKSTVKPLKLLVPFFYFF